MALDPIQWFPGHMAKTRRLIAECLSEVDIVLELLDARIPKSSKNPEILKLTAGKPKLTLLNKASLADPGVSDAWLTHYEKTENRALLIDCVTGDGIAKIGDEVRRILADKIARNEARGMAGRRLSAMIVGIPNVGKSSLINRLAGGKRAKVENRPGVTTAKQWVTTSIGLSLLDTPGVLWPKFDEKTVGENLALTGAIRDGVLDVETLAMTLAERLTSVAPSLFYARYKLTPEETEGRDGYDLLETVGRKRGFLVAGGEVNMRRTAEMLLDEFRSGVIGRISLEKPSQIRRGKNGGDAVC
ncbi:MAG: ribosome biogenesis GTPase YlqF [Clostridia bacterium]|nr:ribosome biogenesis GTPase YlqF [Clostridia bacterium]